MIKPSTPISRSAVWTVFSGDDVGLGAELRGWGAFKKCFPVVAYESRETHCCVVMIFQVLGELQCSHHHEEEVPLFVEHHVLQLGRLQTERFQQDAGVRRYVPAPQVLPRKADNYCSHGLRYSSGTSVHKTQLQDLTTSSRTLPWTDCSSIRSSHVFSLAAPALLKVQSGFSTLDVQDKKSSDAAAAVVGTSLPLPVPSKPESVVSITSQCSYSSTIVNVGDKKPQPESGTWQGKFASTPPS